MGLLRRDVRFRDDEWHPDRRDMHSSGPAELGAGLEVTVVRRGAGTHQGRGCSFCVSRGGVVTSAQCGPPTRPEAYFLQGADSALLIGADSDFCNPRALHSLMLTLGLLGPVFQCSSFIYADPLMFSWSTCNFKRTKK